jgi:soluble lytic murein transglycosylase
MSRHLQSLISNPHCALLLLPAFFFLLASCTQPLPFFGPTATPTPTLTPTPTATPTPSPTPTPTPTPPPAARLAEADEAMFAGDWSRALAVYQLVLEQSDDAPLRAAAQLGIGKARLYGGDPNGAAREFAQVLEQFPESPLVADAHFLLGETFRALGLWAQAVEGYRNYQQRRGKALDSYVEERVAQALAFSGDYANAALAYRAAIAAPRAGDTFALRERLAEVYLALNDWQNAVGQYEAIFGAATDNALKARALILSGDAHYANGFPQVAYEKYLAAVNNYPEAPITFRGLLKLVNDGVPVDDLPRGLSNYHAQNYGPALAAFERVLAADPTNTTALYHRGLTLNALQRKADAIAAFRQLVENFPNDPLWQPAFFQIAFIQDYPADVQTFRDFARRAPQHPQAPDALYRAARLCERNNDFATAVLLWDQIAREYPQAEQAADAAMQAGLVLYRSGDLSSAAQRFELATTLGSDAPQTPFRGQGVARGWLWIGKVKEKQGNREGAREAWTRAAATAPADYYGLRAAQLLAGRRPFAPPRGYDFDFDAARERAEAERWLRETFPQAAGLNDLSTLSEGLRNEARFVRGAELWRLGLHREAHAEFNSLRLDVQADPVALWQLALYWNEIGAYDLSIRSARRVLDLAGLANPDAGPTYLQRLRFPAPFAPLVIAASNQYGLHPFVMYSKMRIESFFWKYAVSSAQARGLNQIIPATANDIAAKLNLSNFQQEDLFRPALSIPMGAFYLDFVGRMTGGETEAQLAGYYAGPGNAQAWLNLAAGDPDLFVEVIRLPDAKGYVQTTFEYFEVYNTLYGLNAP